MIIQPDSRFNSLFRSFARVGSFVVVFIGCLVLLGWSFDIAILKSVLPGTVTMKANTAVGFLLASASLWLALSDLTDRRIRSLKQACAVVVTLIGLLTLFQYLSGLDLGIDQLLFQEPAGTVSTSNPGRMSPNTALNFLLIGLGLLLLDWETRHGHNPAQFLIILAGVIALLGLLGYAYGVSELYGLLNYTSMAVNTVAAFIVLCLAMLFARPEAGLMAIIISSKVGGFLARRLLPVALVVPIALGWIGLLGERAGLYDTEFGVSLIEVANSAILVIVILATAHALNRVDFARHNAEEALRLAYTDLEKRVTERTFELAVSERIFRDLAETSFVGIYRTSLKGEILYVNAALAHMMGFDSPEEMKRAGVLTRYRDPRERQTLLASLQRDGKVESFETVLLTRSESPLHNLMSVTLNNDIMTGTIVDITARKHAEEALRQSEERFRSTLESMMEGCQIIGFDWRYLFINDAAVRQGMLKKDEMIGHTMSECYPGIENTEMFTSLRYCMDERTSHRMINEFVYPDGSKGWFELSIQPAPNGIFILSSNITARKQAEEQLRNFNAELEQRIAERTLDYQKAKEEAKNANLAKSEFLSRMSHELRTPLNSILGFAQLMEMEELDAEFEKNIKHILKAGRHLLDMINEILDIARIDAGRLFLSPEPVELQSLILETLDIVSPLAYQRLITLELSGFPGECRIRQGRPPAA